MLPQAEESRNFAIDMSVLFLEPCIPWWLDATCENMFTGGDPSEKILSDEFACQQTAVSEVLDAIRR